MNPLKSVTLLYLLATAIPVFGQIIIDWNEIPHVLDTRWTKNIKDTAVVNLGSPGGPQSWNFTSQPMGNDSCTNVVVSLSQTPFHDSFPNANLVYAAYEGPDTSYLYMQRDPSFLCVYGLGGFNGGDTAFIRYNPIDTNDLPEHYGDYRAYLTAWTVGIDANTYMRYQKRGYEFINAYGSVTIPYGTFECLRYVLWDALIATLYYYGAPLYSDTSTRIGHQFVAENRSGVVCVYSFADETNPYFANALILERMTHFAMGTAEMGKSEKSQLRCYPNPFRDHVSFTYCLTEPGRVSLTVYDVQGQRVKTIVNGIQAQGTRSIAWYGTDTYGNELPEGIYFYDLKIEKQSERGKIIFNR